MNPISSRFTSASLLSIPHTSTIISAMAFSSSSSSKSPTFKEKDEEEEEKLRLVLKYHNQTKHSFTSYAKGPRGLDWSNQPNPFRRFLSAPLLPLNESSSSSSDEAPLYSSLFDSLPPPKPISLSTISQLFYHSLALSAWKTIGTSTWPLRVNPSSGNLHPTEAYLIAPPIDSLSDSAFVAHYAPKEHSLEVRAHIPPTFFPKFFPENSFLIGVSSIFWREAWKYGERAFRYCSHDVGHAIAALSIAAGELGWDLKLLDGLGAEDLKKLMGLNISSVPEIESEHPDCLLLVFPNGTKDINIDYHGLSSAISSEFPSLEWKGKPNVLSKEHRRWDIIYTTAQAVEKPPPLVSNSSFSIDASFRSSGVFSQSSYKKLTVREVVRSRRSAVDMDGVTFIDKSTFYQMLMHCLPSGGRGETQKQQLALPFRALPWDNAEVHLALFVHRVSGLPKGLYFLVRNEDHLSDLKRSTRSDFEWERPDGCPDDLPLYKLVEGDCKKLAKGLSCHQDIAGDGCFSLGMVARFDTALRENGSWMYPRLFWETGVIGQVLYLEAHAMGISATGIGCYFDDPVHEVLGFKDLSFQSLYHFTVGGPVLDKRIMTLPAYPGPTTDA
uniref:Nitroreductase domain-containing protein n=1 Tax=Noccaea caerulescens TaxID=107243 RepID=A0A1J3I436_NOCCA